MGSPLVLIVEDEEDIRELVRYNLDKAGFQVAGVATGEEALASVASKAPDLVLLDLMLPGVDGLTVCQRLKGNPSTASIPVVILTAKGEESDIVKGLNFGADDYVTKPFSPKVLIARVQAVLRRSGLTMTDDGSAQPIRIHELLIDLERHEVLVEGKAIELTSTEFRVLALLTGKPGWVFTRQRILDGVHGQNYAITDRAVDVQVVGLRKKLGPAARHLETVRGVGYRFKE